MQFHLKLACNMPGGKYLRVMKGTQMQAKKKRAMRGTYTLQKKTDERCTSHSGRTIGSCRMADVISYIGSIQIRDLVNTATVNI